jgi:hypothetical protein
VFAHLAAGFPELRNPQVLVKGDRSHFSRFSIDGKYFGGREGASVITWSRSKHGGPYELIPGVDTKVYQVRTQKSGEGERGWCVAMMSTQFIGPCFRTL